MNCIIRHACPGDETAMVQLVRELAAVSGHPSPIDEHYVRHFLAAPHTDALLAEDDETAVGAYLARAIFDEGKTAAIVYCNRGTGGGNTKGIEQVAAMAPGVPVQVPATQTSLVVQVSPSLHVVPSGTGA